MIEWQNEPNLTFISQTEAFKSAPEAYRLPTVKEFYELQKTRTIPPGGYWTCETWFSKRAEQILGVRVIVEESGIDQVDSTGQDNELNFAWYVKESK